MKKALLIPYTFNVLNWAAVVGLFHFLRNTAARDIWVDRRVHAFTGFER